MKSSYQNFEDTFSSLLKEAKEKPIPMEAFLTTLSGRGRVLLLLFLSLGFAQIPGISNFLGLFICYLGIRISMGNSSVWIPKFLRHKKIPSYLFIKIIGPILKMVKFIRHWSRPRYKWATEKKTTQVVNGIMIALVGFCLTASPPIPLTGIIACIAIFLISIGLLNNDGVYILLGYVFSIIYLGIVAVLIHYFSFPQIFRWVENLFC